MLSASFSESGFRRLWKPIALAAILPLLLLVILPAQASTVFWHEDYPGREAGDAGCINVASQMVQSALQGYYRVYGEWPVSWQAVEDAGLFQTRLQGFQLETIDPDDAELSFYGDMFYDASTSSQEKVRLLELSFRDGPTTSHVLVSPSPAYADLLPTMQHETGEIDSDKYLGDVNWLKLLSIRASLRQSIELFKMVHARYPSDIDELLDSGLTLVDRASTNPMTGQPFRFDGSEFDFRYELMPDGRYDFHHTEEDGQRASGEFLP